ncbi:hypothetical protein E2C01_090460 [Portunus trituberculatus]|uniref:Uncharacterized protein n=1 Tax=Portunus trituberculatus TaxID=210409 RepID=A0A5B7JQE4_PORTR|nr:hypothetical protein [Portunus trituberculatus]
MALCLYQFGGGGIMLIFPGMITVSVSLCAERITEVILSGMVAYIPHSFLILNLLNPDLTQPVSCYT